MRKAVEVPIPIRIDKLTEVVRIYGTPVYLHWSVLAIAILILINVIHHPAASILGLGAYWGVLFIHELGHLIAARWERREVLSIQIYPIFGVTRFGTPWSRFDHCVIAWGGVIAQVVVALPFIAWVLLFGYTRFESINAVLALLGFFSVGVAIVNLLPFPPLDGAIAWAIIPESIKLLSGKKGNRPKSYRY